MHPEILGGLPLLLVLRASTLIAWALRCCTIVTRQQVQVHFTATYSHVNETEHQLINK